MWVIWVLLGLECKPSNTGYRALASIPLGLSWWQAQTQSWGLYLVPQWAGMHQQWQRTSLFLVLGFRKNCLFSFVPVFIWALTLQLSLSLAADSACSPSTWFIQASVGPSWEKAYLGVFNTFPCQTEEGAALAEWGDFQESSGQKSICNFKSGTWSGHWYNPVACYFTNAAMCLFALAHSNNSSRPISCLRFWLVPNMQVSHMFIEYLQCAKCSRE